MNSISKDTKLTIDIPESYIGKEVEFIIFPLNEQQEINTTKQKNKKSLKGVFSKYANSSKVVLEDSAWKNYIIKKFK